MKYRWSRCTLRCEFVSSDKSECPQNDTSKFYRLPVTRVGSLFKWLRKESGRSRGLAGAPVCLAFLEGSRLELILQRDLGNATPVLERGDAETGVGLSVAAVAVEA